MLKLITGLITLLFCLPLNAQSTSIETAHPFYQTHPNGKEDLSVINVGILNSVYHDYCPLIFNKGLLFTSDRTKEGRPKNADANFYFSAFSDDRKPGEPRLMEGALNSTFQEGMAAISPDGKTIVFSRDVKAVKKAKGFSDVRLYIAYWEDGKWSKAKKMSINSKNHSSGHPAFSPDGNKLYFVSNRPGGYGATDIYVSKKRKGKWTKPKNLDKTINTSKSELFPFVDEAGMLYFSVNKKSGHGLLDIYVSIQKNAGNWSRPINMGEPFNSKANDFGFYIAKDGKSGYLSSNRAGGLGGNDIYSWGVLEKEPVTLIEDQSGAEQRTCVNLNGHLTDTEGESLALANVRILITNLSTGMEKEIYSDERGAFEDCLDCKSDFSISAYPENYYLNKVYVSTKSTDCNSTDNIQTQISLNPIDPKDKISATSNMNDLGADPKLSDEDLVSRNAKNKSILESISIAEGEETIAEGFNNKNEPEEKMEEPALTSEEKPGLDSISSNSFSVIPNIYYDFNSYQIAEADKNYLNDLATYLKDNPALKLAIKSYTDTKGKKAYNKWLSKRRAETVVAYLMETGVEKVRLKAIGNGELTAENDRDSDSRRTEFEIINDSGDRVTDYASDTDEREGKEGSLVISDIYYEFNAFQLNDVSTAEVEKLIRQLNNDKNLKVEIRSHTDSRGSKTYNQWLSQKRANEVVRYIASRGIEGKRLSAKGYGESQLVNQCTDNVVCSKSEHLRNRRTEFVFR